MELDYASLKTLSADELNSLCALRGNATFINTFNLASEECVPSIRIGQLVWVLLSQHNSVPIKTKSLLSLRLHLSTYIITVLFS